VTTELEGLIHQHIKREGPMPFAAFMSMALYHPRFGYYAGGKQRTGWAGHFVTSPELDPVFGRMWSRAFEQIWSASGRPASFSIVEIGPGEGTFARSVLSSVEGDFAAAVAYRLVERTPAVEGRQRELLADDSRVTWVKAVDEIDPGPGVVFANEVLDNLPVHLVEVRDGTLLEVLVELAGERLVMTRRPPAGPELADFIARSGIELREGHMHEIPMSTESFVARAAAVVQMGAVILVDYGLDARTVAERPEGTLVCYSASGVDTQPLESVGEKDITVHANWTVVGNALRRAEARVIGPRMQRRVLTALGLADEDRELRRAHDDAIGTKRGADAVRSLSRRQALGALADPGGLGGLQVVVGLRGIEPPPFIQESPA
jgi:SAM-dependent MidA family methyltransferase